MLRQRDLSQVKEAKLVTGNQVSGLEGEAPAAQDQENQSRCVGQRRSHSCDRLDATDRVDVRSRGYLDSDDYASFYPGSVEAGISAGSEGIINILRNTGGSLCFAVLVH